MKEYLVVPCYEEEHRLELASLDALLTRETLTLVLVDDGSKDGTRRLLESYRDAHHGRVLVHVLPQNRGKAEAVRQGLVLSLESGADIVGYTDADFATPTSELVRLLERLHQGELDLVFGARVRVFGSQIRREGNRHILGRVFASIASFALGEAVYDTQCGAKWFRRTEALENSVSTPFESDWAFDVELFARLFGKMGGPSLTSAKCLEIPLEVWRDVPESKVKLSGMVKSLLDLAGVYRRRQKGPRLV
jgi:glycosyltransferase involved in cell wall biosynthesis